MSSMTASPASSPSPFPPSSSTTPTLHNGPAKPSEGVSVAEVKENAIQKAQRGSRGVSALSLISSAKFQTSLAQAREGAGDLKGALSALTKAAGLIQSFMDSAEFKAENVPGKRGVLWEEFSDFQEREGSDLTQRAQALESRLTQVERSAATQLKGHRSRPPGNGVQKLSGGSIADRRRSFQEASLSVSTTKRAGAVPSPLAPRADSELRIKSMAEPRDLHNYMYRNELKVLILDVRTREAFDCEHIRGGAVVCIEPSVLLRERVTGETIEESLTVQRHEWVYFHNRDKFDLIAIYDGASETPGPPNAPLARLIRAIYETASRKFLKREPVLLVGGLEAWKREFGVQELVVGKAPVVPRPVTTPLKSPPAKEVYVPPSSQRPVSQLASSSRPSPPGAATASPHSETFGALPPAPRIRRPNRTRTGSTATSMSNELNTWSEPEPQEHNIDEETETCVGDEGNRRSIAPTNYLRISKEEASVNGQFILDLSLPPPPPPPGIASDTDLKNLTLHTKSGPITAEIWIRHDGSTKSKRVSLDLCSGNGSVRAIVHDSFPSGRRVLPFLDMELRASYGDIYVSLPRCFRGPITIRTGDDIALSPALGERTALISDVSGTRVYFVGDRPRGGKWGGRRDNRDNRGTAEDSVDELSVDGRYTSVRINCDGEGEVPVMMPNSWKVLRGSAERFLTTGRVC